MLTPVEGEKVISKDQVNAFLDTGLLEALHADSIEALVICGMQTHMCLEAAVRAAHDFGFACTVVQDACATRALQYEEQIIPAKNVHYSTIQTLQGNYAQGDYHRRDHWRILIKFYVNSFKPEIINE